MKKILSFLLFFILPITIFAKSKIIDAFLFYNEYEILEIRLNELYPYVDKFVIVEFTETFKGLPKDLNYPKIAPLLKKFSDKIVYYPCADRIATSDPWNREFWQRSRLNVPLANLCNDEDIVMLSDVDEIPHHDTVVKMSEQISSGKEIFVSVYYNTYQFFLNRLANLTDCTIWTSWDYFKKHHAQTMREARRYWGYPKTVEKGWHLTSMGGSDRVLQKMRDFSHSEDDINEIANEPKGKPITHETMNKIRRALPIVPIDDSFPEFIYKNIEYMDELGLIDHDMTYIAPLPG